ncbi:MAG: HAMP domain-containing sensor histidine kinase [Candidatus Omnitrophota bacterium]
MNLLLFFSFLVSLSGIACIIFICSSRALNQVKVLWALFNLTIILWGTSFCLWLMSGDQWTALFWLRSFYVISIFIPISFIHFSFFFSKEDARRKHFLIIQYCISIGLAFFIGIFSRLFISDSFNTLSPHHFLPGLAFGFPFLLLTYQFAVGAWFLYIKISHSTGAVRDQNRYILIGLILAYSALGLVFWGIAVKPVCLYLVFLMALSAVIVTCAAIRHRLIDIRLVMTRAGILIVVYAVVLVIPIYCYDAGYAFGALMLALSLATAAPCIYSYLRKRLEDSILDEQRLYRDIMFKASHGLSRLKTTEEITYFVVRIFFKMICLKNTAFYLFVDGRFHRKDVLGNDIYPPEINMHESFLDRINSGENCVTYEFHRDFVDNSAGSFSFNDFPASAALVVKREARLLGVIFLGERLDGIPFSDQDLTVFNVIADHAALSIENSYYLSDTLKRAEEDGQRARVASLDAMASSLAHEIDNPNAVIIGQAELVAECISADGVLIPENIRKDIKTSLDYILESSRRVAGMVDTILEYSRMGPCRVSPVSMASVLESFELLIRPEMKKHGVLLFREIAPDLPNIHCNKVHLEEILMNFAANAIFAVQGMPGDKKIILRIFCSDMNTLRFEFSDNGMGIPHHLIKDIFLPSVTTKGSAQGTGLGLYRVRKIVDFYKGRVWAESNGNGHGACFIVEFPIIIPL